MFVPYIASTWVLTSWIVSPKYFDFGLVESKKIVEEKENAARDVQWR